MKKDIRDTEEKVTNILEIVVDLDDKVEYLTEMLADYNQPINIDKCYFCDDESFFEIVCENRVLALCKTHDSINWQEGDVIKS